MDEIDLSNAILIADGASGIYAPQAAVNHIHATGGTINGCNDEDIQIVEAGPDEDGYWDAWNEIETNATVSFSQDYVFHQDQDVWIIPT